MLKDILIELVEQNKEGMKISFKIDEEEIKRIIEFLNKSHKDFRGVVDDLSESNINDRGKMAICCLIGYVNGKKLMEVAE